MVEFIGYDQIMTKLSDLYDATGIKSGMGKACAAVEATAKQKAPKDTGALRRSITSEVEADGSEVDGIIFTPLEYAAFCEYGTGLFAEAGNGRKTPWAYKDDEDNWHYTHGQHPQPYMRPALNENREKIITLIKEGLMND